MNTIQICIGRFLRLRKSSLRQIEERAPRQGNSLLLLSCIRQTSMQEGKMIKLTIRSELEEITQQRNREIRHAFHVILNIIFIGGFFFLCILFNLFKIEFLFLFFSVFFYPKI